MAWKERYMEAVDVETSYRLAKEMESYRSNPKLGYRPAGSRAEFETGERLKKEMEAMGLSNVRKDEILVDGWEFEKAELSYIPYYTWANRGENEMQVWTRVRD